MTREGVESGAAGMVGANQNQQGNANNQRLQIKVSGLTGSTPYQLFAILGEDTNRVQVTEFDTDANGNAALDYSQIGNGNGNGKSKKKMALPSVLNPLSDIRELAVFNTNAEAILTADLTAPDKLQYLIKRDASEGNVDASLRIKATTVQTQFRLVVSGLVPTADYLLVFNDQVVQANTSDERGNLAIFSLVENPTDILDLHSVALWDSSSNVVLSTELP